MWAGAERAARALHSPGAPLSSRRADRTRPPRGPCARERLDDRDGDHAPASDTGACTPAESVTPQDIVGAVAELLAAAAQVGAMPTWSLTANVDGEAGVVTVSAWEGDVTGPTIAWVTAGSGRRSPRVLTAHRGKDRILRKI